jgi:hypothetical protein
MKPDVPKLIHRPGRISAILLATLVAQISFSQTIVQTRHTFDQGGGKGSGSTLAILQSIGQPILGGGVGTDVALGGGFLAPTGNSGGTVEMTAVVSGGWNMLSVPLEVPDSRKSTLFPTAVSNAFRFTTMYASEETLRTGVGYWMKFRGPEPVMLAGFPRAADTVDVRLGWNLIGMVSTPVAPASVGSVPAGMVVSNFFTFEGMYVAADTLRPWKAYWVKVFSDGVLLLSSQGVQFPAGNRVRIVPDDELPPPPPGDGLADGSTGVPGTLPSRYALHQNYPNPFNPVTVIRFDLPEPAYVLLRVYNMLGGEVATLVDGDQGAGFREVEFGTAGLPSGVYWYRLSAGSYSSIKKMMVLK